MTDREELAAEIRRLSAEGRTRNDIRFEMLRSRHDPKDVKRAVDDWEAERIRLIRLSAHNMAAGGADQTEVTSRLWANGWIDSEEIRRALGE